MEKPFLLSLPPSSPFSPAGLGGQAGAAQPGAQPPRFGPVAAQPPPAGSPAPHAAPTALAVWKAAAALGGPHPSAAPFPKPPPPFLSPPLLVPAPLPCSPPLPCPPRSTQPPPPGARPGARATVPPRPSPPTALDPAPARPRPPAQPRSRRGLGGARGAPARPVHARCPRRARRTRGSRPWRLGPARLGVPRPYAARPRPGVASNRAVVMPLRSAARALLGPGVCATCSRHVSAALRVRTRVAHGALARLVVPSARRIAPCRVRDALVYPLDTPVYPPPPVCTPCVVIVLFN
jgi:hypothetical protein